jgi:Trypsin-like peptidase domain
MNTNPKTLEHLLRHVVPLFTSTSRNVPEMVGTGFFVHSRGLDYLVSAAHVLDMLATGRPLYFYSDFNVVRHLHGKIIRTKVPASGTRGADRLDIGAVQLTAPGLPPYPSVDKLAVSVDDLYPRALPRDGKLYLVTGFPASRSRRNSQSRTMGSTAVMFQSISAETERYAALGTNPNDSIVLKFDVKNSALPNGRVQSAPNPAGMSGSPVWLVADSFNPTVFDVTPLVGVAIEHHKVQRAIVVTDIRYVLLAIWSQEDA